MIRGLILLGFREVALYTRKGCLKERKDSGFMSASFRDEGKTNKF